MTHLIVMVVTNWIIWVSATSSSTPKRLVASIEQYGGCSADLGSVSNCGTIKAAVMIH